MSSSSTPRQNLQGREIYKSQVRYLVQRRIYSDFTSSGRSEGCILDEKGLHLSSFEFGGGMRQLSMLLEAEETHLTKAL